MEQASDNIVDIRYEQTGAATATNELGMREMQAKAYEARDKRFLLIKAPPASGKSRALMFIALDKLMNQGLKKVVVAVPEKSIGRSFKNTNLKEHGFFADWHVTPYYDLCDVKNEKDKKGRFVEFFQQDASKVLVCAHATLRNGMKELADDCFDHVLLAIDEFHHTSADASSNLGDVVRRVMNNSTGHIVAMTGSYFRGDGIPVLRQEDEARFYPVTYNYYQQLNGYQYLKNLVLGYHFYRGNYLDHIDEVLDTRKKTIIHIPSVNARASTGKGKYAETEDIMRAIGKVERKDYDTCIYNVRTQDGRLLKVADLVEDAPQERNRVQGYLQRMKRAEDMDIIIALGTNYELDPQVFLEANNSKKLDGFAHPHEKVTAMIEEASEKSFDQLRERHIADYTELFSRVALNLSDEIPEITTDELLDQYRAGTYHPPVEELLFAFGRYTLIASSRTGNLPPNLNGIWIFTLPQ